MAKKPETWMDRMDCTLCALLGKACPWNIKAVEGPGEGCTQHIRDPKWGPNRYGEGI